MNSPGSRSGRDGFFLNSKWTWSFAMLAVAQAALVLGFEAYVFATFQTHIRDNAGHLKSDPTTTIPTFLALYIFAFIYQLVLVWDALSMKNTIQVIGLVGLNLGLLIYGAVQVEQLQEAVADLAGQNQIQPGVWRSTRGFLIAIPCILAFFTIAMGFVAWKLYDEFAWTIYKHISADLRMKRRYLTYQIYIALLKFDFFFFLGFTIQFVVIVGGRDNIERWLTVAAIPVTILIMLFAVWATRRESYVGSIITIVLYFCGLAYFIFKLYRMYQPGKMEAYTAARKELTTFAVLTILLLLMTIVVACMCVHNYNKGLMPYIRKSKSSTSEEKPFNTTSSYDGYHTEMLSDPYGRPGVGSRPAQTRMEID